MSMGVLKALSSDRHDIMFMLRKNIALVLLSHIYIGAMQSCRNRRNLHITFSYNVWGYVHDALSYLFVQRHSCKPIVDAISIGNYGASVPPIPLSSPSPYSAAKLTR